MAVVFGFAGSKFYIGGPKTFSQSDLTASSFTGETWVEVQGIESIGEFGDQAQYGSFTALGDRRTTRFLSMFEGSDFQISMARNIADPGQSELRDAGLDPGTNYAFKIEYDDAPPGGTPSQDMFIGLVSPLRRSGGTNTDALKWVASIATNSNIVEIAPAPAP